MVSHAWSAVACRGWRFASLAALLVLCRGPASDVRAECAEAITPSPAWKDTVAFAFDPFVVGEHSGSPSWAKFTIRTCDPEIVYFQNGNAEPFHHGFAATSGCQVQKRHAPVSVPHHVDLVCGHDSSEHRAMPAPAPPPARPPPFGHGAAAPARVAGAHGQEPLHSGSITSVNSGEQRVSPACHHDGAAGHRGRCRARVCDN